MDSKRVVNNSIALFVMDLSSKLVPLVTFPWILHALGPEGYGKVGFAAAVTGFFGLLASPGFRAYGVREAARAAEAPRTLVQKLMSARILLAVCSCLLLVGFTFTFAPRDQATRIILLITGAGILVKAVDVQWLYIGHSKMWRVSLVTIVGQLVYMAMILSWVHRPGDAWIVPLAAAVSIAVGAAILLNRAHKDFDIGLPKYMPEAWAKILPICAVLGIASMMSMIYDQIDTVMLRYMRTEAEVGLYVASYRLMAISMSFLTVLATVFFPLFSGAAKRDAHADRRYAQWMANSSIALALPIAAGGFVLAQPVSRLVMGARFAGAEHLLRWLMLNLLSASAAVLFASRLVPNNRERKYLLSVASGAVANVALNLVFIPKYGAIAAVFTTIVAQAIVAAMAFYFSRDLPQPVFARPLVVSLIATAAMIGGILAAQQMVNVNVVVVIAGGAGVYGLALLALQALWNQFARGEEAAVAVQGRSE
ncbi:MAG: flippase [Terriglobia bacterium]|nr:flippase [Terriglobia bacterium]